VLELVGAQVTVAPDSVPDWLAPEALWAALHPLKLVVLSSSRLFDSVIFSVSGTAGVELHVPPPHACPTVPEAHTTGAQLG